MQNCSLLFSSVDKEYVTACLAREPQGVLGVAARNEAGQPTVITNLPLVQEKRRWAPFPTLYWLVDPAISAKIAEIERQGGVREIEEALRADGERLEQHRADNVLYAMSRWAVLNPEEKEIANKLALKPVLEDSGIGGVANHDAIKCLHAQYAFHLARHEAGTTVGRLIRQRYEI